MTTSHPALSDVDIKLLRVFSTIVECGGFTQAQTELNLSRSTISTHMAHLETRLGFRLCQRGRAGFSVTSQGQAVFDATRSLLSSIEGYHAQITQLREKIVGEITVGAVDNIITNSLCHLHKAIRNALSGSDDLRIILRIGSPDQVREQLVRGQVQIAVAPKFQALKSISQKLLFPEQQLLYCGRDHPLFKALDADLTEEVISQQSYVRRGFVSVLTPYSAIFKRTALAVSYQMEGLAHFILSGQCVGFLPEDYASQWVERGEMRVLRPDLFGFEVPICLSREEHRQHSIAASHVFDAILGVYQSA